MAKDVVQSGGQELTDQSAAACLAQGNPKAKLAPVKWGMKDRDGGSEGMTGRPGAHDPYAGAKAS